MTLRTSRLQAIVRIDPDELDTDKLEENIKEMGYAPVGLHLRHVIPYSDIAGAFYVATSNKTLGVAGQGYVNNIRAQILELARILGVDMSELDEDDLSKWNGCLQDGRRENVQQLFHQLIHTPENLFYGGSTANVALGNRPDITDDARGVLGYDHVDKLLSWWIYTMKRLGLNPKEEWVDNIYWAFTEKYIRKKLFSHDLSRPLGPLFGNPSELG